MKSLARDLLRIVTFIPYPSPNLEKVIDRAWWWSDDIFALVEPGRKVDAVTYEFPMYETGPEGFPTLHAVGNAWSEFTEKLRLSEKDYVAFLLPDEVVVDYSEIRPVLRHNYGKVLMGISHQMQDGHYVPEMDYTFRMFFPYKHDHKWYTFGRKARSPFFDQDTIGPYAVTVLDYSPVSHMVERTTKWWGGGEL